MSVNGLTGEGITVDFPRLDGVVDKTALDDSGDWAAFCTDRRTTACHLPTATLSHLPSTGIRGISFRPRHGSIALRSHDRLYLWHLSPQSVRRIDLPLDGWNDVAFSPDGRLVASCEGRVSICELETGNVREMRQRQIHACCVAFSADGSTVVGAGGWRFADGPDDLEEPDSESNEAFAFCQVQAWDVSSGRSVATLEVEDWDEKPELHGGAGYSPDGRQVVALDSEFEKQLQLWSARSGRRRANPEAVSRLAPGWDFPFHGQWSFAPNGRVLVVVQDSVQVCFYDAARLRLLATAVFLHGGREWFVATPDGRYDGSPGTASDVEWRSGRHSMPLESLPDRRLPGLLGCLLEGKLPPSGVPPPASLKTSPRRVVCPVHSGTVDTINCPDVVPVARGWLALFERPEAFARPGHGGIVLAMPPSRVLVAGFTRIQIWEFLGAPHPLSVELPLPRRKKVDDCIVAAAVSPDHAWFAVATAGGWLSLGRTTDASWVAPPVLLGELRPVSLSFRVDSIVLAIGGHDGDLALCDLRPWLMPPGQVAASPEPIYVQLGAASEASAVEVAFSGGKLLATLGDRLLVLDGSSLAPVHSHLIPPALRWDLVSPKTCLNPETENIQNGAAIWTRTGQVVLQDSSFATADDGRRRAVSAARDPLRIESGTGSSVQIPLDAPPAASWRRPVTFLDAQQLLTLEGTGGQWGLGVWGVDGQRLASPQDTQAALTQGRGRPPLTWSHVARLTCAAADRGGRTLVVGVTTCRETTTTRDATRQDSHRDPRAVSRDNGALTLWDTTPWGGIVSRPPTAEGELPVVVAAARRQVLQGYPGGTVVARAWPGGSAVSWQAHLRDVMHLEVSEDEKHVLTVGDDLRVRYWRLADVHLMWEVAAEPGADTKSWWMSRHWRRTACLLPGSAGVVAACAARGVVRYSLASGNEIGDALSSVAPTRTPALATSRCGTWLGAAVGLNTPLLWHLPSGELRPLCTSRLQTSRLAECDRISFSPDSRWMAASDGASQFIGGSLLVVWDVASGDVILTLANHEQILCTSFTPDGRILILVDTCGLQFREMPSGQLLATAVCLEEPHRPWSVFTPGGEMDSAPYRMHPPARRVAESLPVQGMLGGLALPGLLGRILAGERFGAA